MADNKTGLGLAIACAIALGGMARADEAIAKPAATSKPLPDGGLYLGLGGGYSPDAAAGASLGLLVIDRPLFSRFGIWIGGESSYLARDPEADLILRILVGVRGDLWRSDGGRARLQATLSFAHQHEASVSAWEAHPFSNALGESKDGLGHRSGMDGGLALLLSPWADRPGDGFLRRVRVLVRASCAWIPDDNGPHLYLGLTSAVGVAL